MTTKSKKVTKIEIAVKSISHGFIIPMVFNTLFWYILDMDYQDIPVNLLAGLSYILIASSIYFNYKYPSSEAFFKVALFTVILFIFSFGAWADMQGV